MVNSIREISELLAEVDDAELIEGFVHSILTPSEVDAVASRWELVKMLRTGMSQRAIAAELGLSLCKITRGSRELKAPESPLARIMQIHERRVAGKKAKEET